MRRITQFFLTLLFIMVGVNVVQAQTTKSATFDFTNFDWDERGGTNGSKSNTVDGVTLAITGSAQVRTKVGSSTKCSNGAEFTISGDNVKVSSIVIYSDQTSKRYAATGATCTVDSKSNSQTLAFTSPTAAPVKFTVSGGNANLTSVVVNYTSDGTTTTTYAPSYSTIADQTMTVGDADLAIPTFTVTANKVDVTKDLTFSYSSGNTSAVTIVNGKLHAVAAGTATITVSNAAAGTTEAGSTTFKVTVKAASQTVTAPAAPTITWNGTTGTSFTTSAKDFSTTTITINASDADGVVTKWSNSSSAQSASNCTDVTGFTNGSVSIKGNTIANNNTKRYLTAYAYKNNGTSKVYSKAVVATWTYQAPTKTAVTLSFSSPTTTVKKGATVKNVATASPNVTGITYKSSNTGVAKVASDGTVTGVAKGTATITASYAGDDTHAAATDASYTITVTDDGGTTPTGDETTAEITSFDGLTIASGKVTANGITIDGSGAATFSIGGGTEPTDELKLKGAMSFAVEGSKPIKSIEITFDGTDSRYVDSKNTNNFVATPSGLTLGGTPSGTLATWTDGGAKNVASVNFNWKTTAHSLYIKSVKVTYYNNVTVEQTLTLDKSEVSVVEGGTATVKATASPDGTVTFKSNDTGVATVKASGNTATITGVAEGTTTVTATIGTATKTINVTVTKAAAKPAAPTFDGAAGQTRNQTPIKSGDKVTLASTTEGVTIYWQWSSSSISSVKLSDLTGNGSKWTEGAVATAPTNNISTSGSTRYLNAVAVASDGSTLSDVAFNKYKVTPQTDVTPKFDEWTGITPNQTGVQLDATAQLGLTQNAQIVDATKITISPKANGETVSAAMSDDDAKTVEFTFTNLQPNTKYTLAVPSGAIAAQNDATKVYAGGHDLTFTTYVPAGAEVSLEAKPAAATINTGATTTIATTASDPDGNDITSQLTITYSIDATSTSTGASVDKTGKVTAGSTKGTVVVNVSSAAVTGKYAAATTQVVINVSDGTEAAPDVPTFDGAAASTTAVDIKDDQRVALATATTGAQVFWMWAEPTETAPTISSVDDLTQDNGWYSDEKAPVPDVTDDAQWVLYAVAANGTKTSAIVSQTYNVSNASTTLGQTWNFTTLSSKDDAAYAKDTKNWSTTTKNSKFQNYANKFTSSASGATADYTTNDIDQIKALKFFRNGGTLGTGAIQIFKNYLNFNASGAGIVIPNAEGGDKIIITYQSSSTSNGLNFINGDKTGVKPSKANTDEDVTVYVTDNGDFKFYATSSKVQIKSIKQVKSNVITLNPASDGTVLSIAEGSTTQSKTVTATAKSGSVTATVADLSIASVTDNGNGSFTITAVKKGTTTVTFTSEATGQLDAGLLEYKVTVIDGTEPYASFPEGNEVANRQIVYLDLKNFPARTGYVKNDAYVIEYSFDDFPSKINGISKSSAARANAQYYQATVSGGSDTKNATGNILYLRGIPIIASTANTGNNEQKTVYVTIWKMKQAADGTYTSTPDGDPVQQFKKTFTITSMPTAPAAPTLSPAGATSSKGNKPTLTTDDPVNVIGGADANRVWGKFSSSDTYSADEILNAAGSFGNYTPTAAVFSTVTKTRVISGYSIVVDENGANRISLMAAGWYNYIPPRKPTRVIFYDDATPANVVNTVTIDADDLSTFKEPTPKASYNAGADENGNITWTEYTTTFVNYTSSNTDVATVDATTGKVTFTGNPGTTQISVSTTQTDAYAVGTGSYDITVTNVNKIAAPTITPGTRNYSQPFTSVVKGDGENPFVYTVTVNGTKVETEDGGTIVDGSEAQYDVAIPDNTTDANVVVITAYAYDKDDATKKSSEVSVTYTYKFVSVPKPILTPPGLKEDGSDKDALSYKYTYNTSDKNYSVAGDGTKYLEVTASFGDVVPEGTKIYYTVNSTTDNVTDQDIAYDGQDRIHVVGSQIIRAIAIDGEGNRSPIVTYQYNFDDGLQAPVFYVNGKKVAIGTGDDLYDQSKITKDGDALKVEVYTTDQLTIVGPDEGSADHEVTVHFTVDGSHPTHNSTKTTTTGTQLVASTTAIAIEYCATHSAVSDETIVEFIVTEKDNSNRIWKADEETSPKGNLGGSGSNASGYIVSTNENHKGATQANKDPEAIDDITITFGGMVPSAGPGKGKTSWANFKASAPNSGANIDGVGKYQLNTKADALDENGDLYNHESEVLDKNYERYYKVPAIGSFIKLEPEKDGVVTIYAFQHGGVHYEDGISTKDNFSPAFITVKPVYMIDEVGQSLPAQNIVSNGTLDDNWFDYDPATTFVGIGSAKDGKTEHNYSVEQKNQMYQMYKMYLNSLNDDSPKGTDIAPFNIFSDDYKSFVAGSDADHQAVGTCSKGYGYATISPASVAYTYNVKAGKTYFFFAWRTKIGIRGIRFVPDADYATVTREFKDAADNTADITAAVTADAQYGHGSTWHFDRKFAKDTWAGVVFPFSVSSTKLQQVFGKGTMVSNWYDLQKSGATNYLNFRNHFHQMIPAGVPVLICPTGVAFDGSTIDFTNGVTFENVTTETSTVTDEVSPDGKLKMTGSFDNTHSTPQYGWYIQKGKLVQRIAASPVKQKAGRSWLEGFDSEVKAKVGYTFFTGEDDNETNGIVEINTDDVNDNGTQYEDGVVYDLQGQLITRDSERLGDGSLPKGVYILNGKKYVVK